MFTAKDFPGRKFHTVAEYKEAQRLREKIEFEMRRREQSYEAIQSITAVVVPSDPGALERRFIELEERLRQLEEQNSKSTEEDIPVRPETGTVLRGESRGQVFSLEVLEEGFLCSDGEIYPTLSAAALGVSGNRRSGWKFWTNAAGVPIGEVTGRFKGKCT